MQPVLGWCHAGEPTGRAYADILVVDGNPLEDFRAIGGNDEWFDAEPREADIPTIRIIMKDGKIYKDTL